jgi:hypothetical protein
MVSSISFMFVHLYIPYMIYHFLFNNFRMYVSFLIESLHADTVNKRRKNIKQKKENWRK